MKNSFYAIGKGVVQTEINALKKLKKSINKDFDKIVNSILKCKGKIIFSGVGKSGLVAKKIASININHKKWYFGKSNYDLKKLFSLWVDLTLLSKIYPFQFISILILLVKLAVYPFIFYRFLFKKEQNIQYKISEKTF